MNTAHIRLTVLLAWWIGIAAAEPSLAQKSLSDSVAIDEGVLDQKSADIGFKKRPAPQPSGQPYPSVPLFGDTHLHTSQSFDAVMFGNSLGPEEAYRFARGEEVTSSTGQRAQLSRPLDFLVVADHAEYLGTMAAVLAGDPQLMKDATLKRWHDLMNSGPKGGLEVYGEVVGHHAAKGIPLPGPLNVPQTLHSLWERNTAAAEKANAPGRFTALIGYEWSSNSGGNNLHRVVVFRDGASKANQISPFSSFDSDNPENLWKALEAYEKKTGGLVLAIPHNGHLSNGRMFMTVDFAGNPLTRAYAETRAQFEPLLEITQMKGDGETHVALSPTDEFANFERWDRGNLDLSVDKKPEMLPHEYARSALKLGLQLAAQLGANPYKYGFIGSTDSHTSLATADSDNYFSKLPAYEPSADRWKHASPFPNGKAYYGWEFVASGYAAVWATENTRESLWDAMKRKETYATTGPRMVVRFFGGWGFEATDAKSHNIAKVGYGKGVPMGGDLSSAPAGKAPTFLLAAVKDPIGANLDRIQVVKGWLDVKGEPQEKVYDVAWGGARKPGIDGQTSAGGQYSEYVRCNVREQYRRDRADRCVERPGFQSCAAGLLLPARA